MTPLADAVGLRRHRFGFRVADIIHRQIKMVIMFARPCRNTLCHGQLKYAALATAVTHNTEILCRSISLQR